MGPSFPGQSGSWCGQLIHVARCGSHSAGIRYLETDSLSFTLLGSLFSVRVQVRFETDSLSFTLLLLCAQFVFRFGSKFEVRTSRFTGRGSMQLRREREP